MITCIKACLVLDDVAHTGQNLLVHQNVGYDSPLVLLVQNNLTRIKEIQSINQEEKNYLRDNVPDLDPFTADPPFSDPDLSHIYSRRRYLKCKKTNFLK